MHSLYLIGIVNKLLIAYFLKVSDPTFTAFRMNLEIYHL